MVRFTPHAPLVLTKRKRFCLKHLRLLKVSLYTLSCIVAYKAAQDSAKT